MDVVDTISGARFLIRLLNGLGLWQHDRQSNVFDLLYRWLRRLLHMPFSFLFTALMLIEMLKSKSLEDASAVVYMSLTEAALVIKILSIWQCYDDVRLYLDEITTSKEYQLRNRVEQEFWEREQRLFKHFAVGYHLASFCVVMSGNIGVLFAPKFQLPFMYWVPFEWSEGGRNYWYAYTFDCLSMLWTSMANSCLDMSYCYFLRHLSLLYKLLGMRLETMQHLREEEAVLELRRLFKMHRKIKGLTTRCEAIISWPILSQIILSALVLCFSGYRLQNMEIVQNLGQFFSMLQYLSVMVFQIFLPCYYANEVTVISNKLTTDIYAANWHQYSVPTRKLIFIYMELLKRPSKIKAGGYFEVGLPVFSKTMNNAYSFFALLLNMSK